jgi:hypothetical protein
MNDDRCLEFFYRAIHADLGYIVETNNTRSFVQELHRARKRLKNPLFDNLCFVIKGDQVFILKNSPYPQGVPRKKASQSAS